MRSYGTEGRLGKPGEEIPPSEHVFDFIVFRGSDIKDLEVFEGPAKPAPAPPPPMNLPNDPAIMVSVDYKQHAVHCIQIRITAELDDERIRQ